MKRWLSVLAALTLVACSNDETDKRESEESELQETEEVQTMEDNSTQVTPTSTQQPISEAQQLKEDELLGYAYLNNLEGELQTYIQINEQFNDEKLNLDTFQPDELTVLISEEQASLMASRFDVSLHDQEYKNQLDGYHQALLNTYEALNNSISTIYGYTQGQTTEDEMMFVYNAYQTTAETLSVIRSHVIEYHNNKFD